MYIPHLEVLLKRRSIPSSPVRSVNSSAPSWIGNIFSVEAGPNHLDCLRICLQVADVHHLVIVHLNLPNSSMIFNLLSAISPPSSALKPSHQRINVGISASGLSLVTFFGIKKKIVVHACCGHFPLCSTFFKNSTISVAPRSGSRHTLLLFLLYTVSALFPSDTLLALDVLSLMLHNGPSTLHLLLHLPKSALLHHMLQAWRYFPPHS